MTSSPANVREHYRAHELWLTLQLGKSAYIEPRLIIFEEGHYCTSLSIVC